MAVIFSLSIDPTAGSPGFGGGLRRGERQQIQQLLLQVSEQLGAGNVLTAPIRDINLRLTGDAQNIGTWTYTPIAAT
jgi:hypothetical protein